MPPLILVDAHNLLFRSHFAHPVLSSEGKPTGAIYGFLRAILTLKPISTRLVFCWDHGLPGAVEVPKTQIQSWRQRLCATYKANRQKNEQTALALAQIPKIHEVLCLLGYFQLGMPGLEADDIIGIVCGEVSGPILIYSTDQDLYQLLEGQRVRMIHPKKNGKDHRIITAASVEKSEGIPTQRWAEYLALGGDASDNIKAVRGWGPKKALKLIRAGVKLGAPLRCQPSHLREELQPHWEKLSTALALTHIPQSRLDVRICSLHTPSATWPWPQVQIRDYKKPMPGLNALARFMAFCADYSMNEFMAARHEFFN